MTFILKIKIEDIVRVNRAFNFFLVKVAMIFFSAFKTGLVTKETMSPLTGQE